MEPPILGAGAQANTPGSAAQRSGSFHRDVTRRRRFLRVTQRHPAGNDRLRETRAAAWRRGRDHARSHSWPTTGQVTRPRPPSTTQRTARNAVAHPDEPRRLLLRGRGHPGNPPEVPQSGLLAITANRFARPGRAPAWSTMFGAAQQGMQLIPTGLVPRQAADQRDERRIARRAGESGSSAPRVRCRPAGRAAAGPPGGRTSVTSWRRPAPAPRRSVRGHHVHHAGPAGWWRLPGAAQSAPMSTSRRSRCGTTSGPVTKIRACARNRDQPRSVRAGAVRPAPPAAAPSTDRDLEAPCPTAPGPSRANNGADGGAGSPRPFAASPGRRR